MNLILIVSFILLAAIMQFIAKNKEQAQRGSLFFSLLGGLAIISYAWPYVWHLKEKQIDGWWMIDGFSGLIVLLVAIVYITSLLVAIRYIGHEHKEGIVSFKEYKSFFILFQLFVLCMVIVPLSNNSLLLWLALEGTTLFSTFLVGLYRKKTSIEAAWKYMILCSTGISLGLVGMLLLSYGAHTAGLDTQNIFLLSSLMENAAHIPQNIIKLSFIFLFIGFGTKVGLVPMHTWLPDAHSKAPSPISAIFSAVLLNVALYAILRFKFITDSAFHDSTWTNHLFLIFGFISVILPAFMMLIQENYKRMLAYSSIEHMGLMVFSFGLAPLGAVFGIMHMIGHTFSKSALFFDAGEILMKYKSTKIPNIKNLLLNNKNTALLFIFGILMIVAMPPSALFVSEYGMIAQAINIYPKTSIALFVALGIIAYGMLSLSIQMIFAKTDEAPVKAEKEKWNLTHNIIVFQFIILIVLALYFTTGSAVNSIQLIVNDFLFVK